MRFCDQKFFLKLYLSFFCNRYTLLHKFFILIA